MTDDLTPLEFDHLVRVIPPVRRVNDDAVILERNRAEWAAAQEGAATILDQAGRSFSRAVRGLVNPRERALAGLAPLMLFANGTHRNTRRQTLLALTVAIEGDLSDPEVVQQTGDVDPSSMLYSFLDSLQCRIAQGSPEPSDHFERFNHDADVSSLWAAIRACLSSGPAGASRSSKGQSEYSCLNFDVVSTPASGLPLDEVLAEIDSRIGLESFKQVIREFAAVEKVTVMRRDAGLPTRPHARHMVFTGNPGTGKTTMARLVVDVLAATGSMPDAHLVEVERSQLVGEFLGSSALKTRKMVDAALGGVLLIDEAYALAGTPDSPADRFAQETIDTLVKAMEDERDDLVVILAGYPEGMDRMLAMNPGLSSRLGGTIEFPDYTDEQLIAVFEQMASEEGYDLGDECLGPVRMALAATERGERFGNARLARNLLHAAQRSHALRIVAAEPEANDPTVEDLRTLRLADTRRGVSAMR